MNAPLTPDIADVERVEDAKGVEDTERFETTSATGPQVRAASGPGLARLSVVELRKQVDTGVGMVLVVVAALLAGAFGGGALLLGSADSYGEVARMAAIPGATLAPVLAMLLVTAERSHRTALSTFTLVPRRGRVVAAKAVASMAIGAMVVLLSLVAALVITPVGAAVTGESIGWQLDVRGFAFFAVGVILSALSGWALALAIGNAPAAIVVLLVWPMLSSMILGANQAWSTVVTWLDITAVARLADGASVDLVAKATVGILVWVVVPAVVGIRRVLIEEVR